MNNYSFKTPTDLKNLKLKMKLRGTIEDGYVTCGDTGECPRKARRRKKKKKKEGKRERKKIIKKSVITL